MLVTGAGVLGLVLVKTCSWCMRAMKVSFVYYLLILFSLSLLF